MKLKRLSKIKNTFNKLEDTTYCDSNPAGFKNLQGLCVFFFIAEDHRLYDLNLIERKARR